MSSSQQPLQALYEIALSVGEGRNLTETAEIALSAYLDELDCLAGAVIRCQSILDGGSYELVTKTSLSEAASTGLEAALQQIPDDPSDVDVPLETSLPLTGRPENDLTYSILELPEFGVLVLVTCGRELDSETISALRAVNTKLATACIRECERADVRAERDRYEALVRTLNEPLVRVQPSQGDLLVQRINSTFEATFGWSKMQAVGRPLSTLVGTKVGADDTIPSLGAAEETQSSVTTEIQRKTANGIKEFLFRAAAINPESDQTEYLVLLVDISDESIRQRRLERLNELANILSRILRHNIRNDITVIKSVAEKIHHESEGQTEDDARQIMEKSDQLASTAEKAREMRQIATRGEQESSAQLENVISDAIAGLRSDFPDAEISVTTDVYETIDVHPLLSVVIHHLVENGIVHHESHQKMAAQSSSGGTRPHVEIHTTQQPDCCTIRVRDNGPGIPESEVEVIDRDTETDLKHGSGAGLWIVSQIIDYCDATLDFSVDEEGTTATITLESPN